jgi:hypothetical protein
LQGERSGCLGAVLVFLLLPILLVVGIMYA